MQEESESQSDKPSEISPKLLTLLVALLALISVIIPVIVKLLLDNGESIQATTRLLLGILTKDSTLIEESLQEMSD